MAVSVIEINLSKMSQYAFDEKLNWIWGTAVAIATGNESV
jgi:hypothetical protein